MLYYACERWELFVFCFKVRGKPRDSDKMQDLGETAQQTHSCHTSKSPSCLLQSPISRNRPNSDRLCSSVTKPLLSPSQTRRLTYMLHITHSHIHPELSQNASASLSHRAEGLLWVSTGCVSSGFPIFPPRPWDWQQQLAHVHKRPKNKNFEGGD